MSQSLEARSIEEIDIKKEIEEFPGSVFSARKIRRRIVGKYDLILDQHQEHSLGRRIGDILAKMNYEGDISIYSRSDSNHPIRYIRKRS